MVRPAAAQHPPAQHPPAPHVAHAGAAAPSHLPADEAAFIAAARAGTERYRDVARARDDGYRRVGGELPSLGEHWIHNGRALADTLDPAKPPILVYSTVNGRMTLAGVAYTRFLEPATAYPAFPSSAAHAWHDHNGGVDDEVLPLGHLASPRGNVPPASPTRLRIAVMHAWIGIDNPAGVWTSENWGLPYARLGLAPPAGPPGADARALSLLAGDDAYYLRAIVDIGRLDSAETEAARRIVSEARDEARAQLDRRDRTASLAGVWDTMWDRLVAGVRPQSAAGLRLLRDALSP